MSTLSKALVVISLFWVAQTLANTISGGIGQNIGGGIGVFDQGISSGHSVSGVVSSCAGVIDLSVGCTLGAVP